MSSLAAAAITVSTGVGSAGGGGDGGVEEPPRTVGSVLRKVKDEGVANAVEYDS